MHIYMCVCVCVCVCVYIYIYNILGVSKQILDNEKKGYSVSNELGSTDLRT